MRRQRRGNFNEEKETKKLIYISGAVVAIAIIVFIITYIIYSNALNKNSTGDLTSKITQLSSTQEQESSQASSPIGKAVNEVQQNKETEENTQKIAVNTSNIEKQTTNEVQNKETQNTKTEQTKKEETKETTKETTKVADPKFIKPVEGEILREYAKENLVYSETLKEWVTHSGIDIKAEKTSIVKAAADGTIKSIKNDPRYGITVVIEHVNGYVTVYSNLLTTEFVKEGETIKQGQTIATVGNTATFEIADEAHLHFEILKNNEYINPNDYIK